MTHAYSPTITASELANRLGSQIKGKVILTTGASPSTLGSSFVHSIATASPSLLILAGRNATKLEKVASKISEANPQVQIRVLELELSSLAAVRDSAAKINAWIDVPHIDVLMNNAGVMAIDFKLSPEGVESQFATNRLGHFLFANLLMDKILAASEPRIVNVSSDGHRLSPMRWGDYNFEVSMNHACPLTADSY